MTVTAWLSTAEFWVDRLWNCICDEFQRLLIIINSSYSKVFKETILKILGQKYLSSVQKCSKEFVSSVTEFQRQCTVIFRKLGRPGQSKAWTWLLVAVFQLVVTEQELDQSELFSKIWNRCLYPSGQVNYTVNIPSGYPVIRYHVFQFSDDPEDDPW